MSLWLFTFPGNLGTRRSWGRSQLSAQHTGSDTRPRHTPHSTADWPTAERGHRPPQPAKRSPTPSPPPPARGDPRLPHHGVDRLIRHTRFVQGHMFVRARAPRPSAATCGPGQPVPGSCPASPSAAAGLAVPPAITLQSLRRRHRRQFCSPQPWQLRARASSIRRRRHLTPRAGQRHQPLTARPNLPFPTLASSASNLARIPAPRWDRSFHIGPIT